MKFPEVALRLPDWVGETLADRVYPTVEDRMRLAVELSRLNVRHGTGGPFGAAIFERETGELLAPGVNLVVASGCSVAHAEMVAIMIAQQLIGDFDLGGEGQPPHELITSVEPCAMCLGAIPGRVFATSSVALTTKTPALSASTRDRNHPTGPGSWNAAVSLSRGTCAAKRPSRCSVATSRAAVRSTTPEGATKRAKATRC